MKKPRSIPTTRDNSARSLWIWLLLGLAVLLRLPHLTSSLSLTEASQLVEYKHASAQLSPVLNLFEPPIPHLLTLTLAQFSTQEWWLRMPAFLAGITTIWCVYKLISQVSSSKTALITAGLLSLNAFHISQSQSVLPANLVTLFVSLGWLLTITISRKTTLKPVLIITLILNSILGVYTSYLYFLPLFGQLLFLSFRKNIGTLVQAFIVGIVTLMAFFPWLPYLQTQLKEASPHPSPQSQTSPSELAQVFSTFTFGSEHSAPSPVRLTLSLFFLVLFMYLVWQLRRRLKILPEFILAFWLILPLFFGWICSYIVPFATPEQMLFVLPALEFLYVLVISTGLNESKTKLISVITFSFLIASHLFGIAQLYILPNSQQPQWREVISTISTEFSPTNTAIIFPAQRTFSPWLWYPHQTYPFIQHPLNLNAENAQIEQEMIKVLEYENVIVFEFGKETQEYSSEIERFLTEYNYKPGQLLEDTNNAKVIVYTKGDSFARLTQSYY